LTKGYFVHNVVRLIAKGNLMKKTPDARKAVESRLGMISCSLWLVGCATGPLGPTGQQVPVSPELQFSPVAATHPSLVNRALPELLPIRSFVAGRSMNWGHQVSPDGKKIAWLGSAGGTAVWVKTLGKEDARRVNGNPRYIRWSGDSRQLLLVADQGGDENTHIYVVNPELEVLTPFDLTPAKNSVSHIAQVPTGTSQFVMVSNRRDKKVFDLYQVDLANRKETLMASNPGHVGRWVVDRAGALRARVSMKGELSYLETPTDLANDQWKTTGQWRRSEMVNIFSVDQDSDIAWAVSNKDRDKMALVKINLKDGTEELIFSSPEVDIEWVKLSEKTHTPLHINVMPDYPQTEFFSPELKARLLPLAGGRPADFYVTSSDLQESTLTVAVNTDKGSKSYLLEGPTVKPELIGESGLTRIADKLSDTQAISFQARDGLEIRGYLTLPPGAAAPSDTQTKPLPMVLLVHGGPWVRDQWSFGAINRSLQQFLANRGYAVLQVNYRGSSGYGRAFMEKAVGEFAGKMHDDLLDGVQWAVKSGIADEKKVAIYGASYGGYAALVGATFTPEVFACSIGLVGVTDLARLLETAPPYWDLGLAQWHRFVGHPANPEQRKVMDAKSPLYKAHQATKPILIMHGENDVRVKLEQSELMVDALRKAGKDVRYIVLKGEGHANQRSASNLIVYRETEGFLASCLGGRASGS
jgi:dipeptidyl aminopeptidase/acylaminoacyl peptidase